MKEEWRGLYYNGEDYSDLYEVSNLGNLRNAKTRKLIKTNLVGCGYLSYCASLGHRGKRKQIRVHRAVAENFIENPNQYTVINHIDGNKTNNRADNLEWCTQKQNMEHAKRMGLFLSDEEAMLKAPNRKCVRGINIKTGEIKEFPSIMKAAISLGNTDKKSHISDAINGKRKSAYGYKWELI